MEREKVNKNHTVYVSLLNDITKHQNAKRLLQQEHKLENVRQYLGLDAVSVEEALRKIDNRLTRFTIKQKLIEDVSYKYVTENKTIEEIAKETKYTHQYIHVILQQRYGKRINMLKEMVLWEKVVKLNSESYTVEEISEELAISIHTLRLFAEKHNINLTSNFQRESESLKKEILALYHKNLPNRTIAKKLFINESTVSYYLLREGIKRQLVGKDKDARNYKVIMDYLNGYSRKEIGTRHALNYHNVLRIVNMNIEPDLFIQIGESLLNDKSTSQAQLTRLQELYNHATEETVEKIGKTMQPLLGENCLHHSAN